MRKPPQDERSRKKAATTDVAPAHLRARRYIEERLEREMWKNGDRLPSAAALARAAGVSINALCRALGELRAEGRLVATRGRGIFAGGPAAEQESPRVTRQRQPVATRVAERLQYDLYVGALHDYDALPSMKVLGYRYGVCHRSLQQALRTLTKEGVLDRNGRAYRVVRTSTHSSSTLVCIVDANYAGATPGFQASRRYSEFIRTLEQRCRRHNLRFRLLPFGNQWRTIPAAVGSIRTPLGAVVYLSDAISAHLSELMSGIGAHARSLVVYDDDCANIASSVFPASARCTHYTSSAGSAGGHMGRYLAEMGHRRVVFFSAFHDRAWSRHRFESLRKAMQSAGCQLPEAFAVESADEELGAATAATELLVLQVKRIGTQVTRLLGTDHLAVRDQGLLQNIIRHNMEMDVLRERLYPLFARALKETDATVWVGANDKTALLALEYLREHQVEVPRTISVVGFDDILESMSAQLTTYNFDVSSAARAAFDFIAFPRERTVRHALRREEIEGVVVPRGSVRRSGEGL